MLGKVLTLLYFTYIKEERKNGSNEIHLFLEMPLLLNDVSTEGPIPIPKQSLSRTFTIVSLIPVVILTYIQLVFNIAVVCSIFYALQQTYSVLNADLRRHLDRRSQTVLSEILICSREYIENECSSRDLPATRKACEAWKTCMNQDINHILKTKEGAVVLAEIMNHFFANIDDRTILCCGGLLVVTVFLVNFILSFNQRHRTSPR